MFLARKKVERLDQRLRPVRQADGDEVEAVAGSAQVPGLLEPAGLHFEQPDAGGVVHQGGVQFLAGGDALAAFPEKLAFEEESLGGGLEPVVLDDLRRRAEVAAQEVGLGRSEEQVAPDRRVEPRFREVLRRGGDQPRVLVQHQAALDVEAEIFAVVPREAEGLFDQLIAVERTLEGEEEVGAQPLGLEVGGGELGARPDVLGEFRIVLPGEGGLGDLDEIFPLAVQVGGPAVAVLDRKQLGAFAEADRLLAEEEVRRAVGEGVG